MWSNLRILLLLSVVGVSSAVFSWGRCPDVQVKSDFVVDRYLGTWYQIARYPVGYESDEARCTTAVYSYSQDVPGAIDVCNSNIQPDGTPNSSESIATIPDPNEPAKLKIRFFRCKYA